MSEFNQSTTMSEVLEGGEEHMAELTVFEAKYLFEYWGEMLPEADKPEAFRGVDVSQYAPGRLPYFKQLLGLEKVEDFVGGYDRFVDETLAAVVTSFELELLCHNWCEDILDRRAACWEGYFPPTKYQRMDGYAWERLDYFSQFLGWERVREIKVKTIDEAVATWPRSTDWPVHFSY